MPTGASGARRLAWLVVLALACGGCELGLDVGVDLNRDGGGTLSVAVSADEELTRRADAAGVDPLDELIATATQLRSEGWSVRDDEQPPGGRTVRLSAAFDDATEFNELADELATALAADEVVLLHDLELGVTDDLLTLSGSAGAEPTRVVRDYGITRRRAVRLVRRAEALDYRVHVGVPDEVVSHNAPHVDAGRLVWQVPVGDTVDIAVEATRPGFPLGRALLGALVGALVAALALWLVLRRRQPAARSARMRSFSART